MNRPRESLLSVDIETVPDLDVLPTDFPHEKFPPIVCHRVVSISFVAAEIDRVDGRERYRLSDYGSFGQVGDDEATLLAAFWRRFDDSRPRLVTWNGRSFDVAVLKARAMRQGISAEAWYLSGDKWDAYHRRYSWGWHCDVMEQLSDYGASTKMGLELVGRSLGFAGKIGGHGDQVADMVAAGRLRAVRAYCECDALLTYGCYLWWAMSSGTCDREGWMRALDDVEDFLARHRGAAPHLGEFLDGWDRPTLSRPERARRAAPRFPPPPSLPRALPSVPTTASPSARVHPPLRPRPRLPPIAAR